MSVWLPSRRSAPPAPLGVAAFPTNVQFLMIVRFDPEPAF